MKIRYVLNNAYVTGGTIRTVINQANALCEDHDVEIASVYRSRETPAFAIDPRVRLVPLTDVRSDGTRRTERADESTRLLGKLRRYRNPWPHGKDFRYQQWDPAVDAAIVRYFWAARSGVLITTRPALNLLAAWCAPRRLIRIGQDHMNLASYKPHLRAAIVKAYPRLDAVTVLTEHDLRDYRAALSAAVRVQRIPNGIPPFTNVSGGPERKALVAAGRLTRQKGFDLLVDAFAKVNARHPDWRLHIFGQGKWHAKLQSRIDSYGLTGAAQLRGETTTLPEELASSGMFLRDGFTATGNTDTGAVRLLGAHIGQLECNGARLENTSGPALDGDSLRVDRYMFLRGGFTAIGAGDKGAVRLLGAHIGQLECDGARLENTSGPALHGDRLQVDQAMFLRGGFTATGNSDTGVVRLLGAHIGQLECDGARLENASGPALDGDSLQVDQSLFLRGGFSAIGAGDAGAIRLLGAHIGRQLDCSGARLENASGPALDGDSLQVGQAMFLRDGFTATGAGQAVIGLFGARIGGALWLETGQVSRIRNDGQALVDLDGTTYTGLPQPAALDHWLRLLKDHSPAYAAQPYQQLAAVHRAAGHDQEVRTILMAQRRDQIARNAVRGWDRTWARLTGLTLGYGYQPWRALFMLLAVLTLSVTAAITAGHHRGLAHTSRASTPQAACSTIEQIGIGLDLGTPLLKTGARDACVPTTTIAGQTLAVAGWLLQVLAWAFAALFIAGFTGAVRKT